MVEEVIWRGHDRHISKIAYHIISLFLILIIIYLSIHLDIKFLTLLFIPFLLSYSKYKLVVRNQLEINNKRLVIIEFEKGKYKTYEIELYDIKHIILEQKTNGKGYVIFKTMSSKFEEVKSPYMSNPEEVHHRVRDIIEELKFTRSTLLHNDTE